jgi:hypothetical protein
MKKIFLILLIGFVIPCVVALQCRPCKKDVSTEGVSLSILDHFLPQDSTFLQSLKYSYDRDTIFKQVQFCIYTINKEVLASYPSSGSALWATTYSCEYTFLDPIDTNSFSLRCNREITLKDRTIPKLSDLIHNSDFRHYQQSKYYQTYNVESICFLLSREFTQDIKLDSITQFTFYTSVNTKSGKLLQDTTSVYFDFVKSIDMNP